MLPKSVRFRRSATDLCPEPQGIARRGAKLEAFL
jgi:hypothetical protein